MSRFIGPIIFFVFSFIVVGCTDSLDGLPPILPDGSSGDGSVAPEVSCVDGDGVPSKPAAPAAWAWMSVPGTRCMNGSQTGIAYSLSDTSDRLVIFLAEGGACFDTTSCGLVANPDGFGEAEFGQFVKAQGGAGIFERGNPNNPLRGASFVYVPYCSGDVFAGRTAGRDDARARDVGFYGFDNVTLSVRAAVTKLFLKPSRVLLSGTSAGGFGAMYNYDQVQRAFCSTPVDLLSDSAVPLPSTEVASCLSQLFRDRWGLGSTLPPDCTACTDPNADSGFLELTRFLVNKYGFDDPGGARRFGLISSRYDHVLRGFYARGQKGTFPDFSKSVLSNNCQDLWPLGAENFSRGLAEFKTNVVDPAAHFRVFYIDSADYPFTATEADARDHEWLLSRERLSRTVPMAGGVALWAWLAQMVSQDPAWANVTF